MNIQKEIRRGEIYYANLNSVVGSEQGGFRPVLIVQNDMGNKHSATVIIVPITHSTHKRPLPTHVVIPHRYGFDSDCIALAEQIRTIDRMRIIRYMGCIDEYVQSKVDNALLRSVGINKHRT